MADYESLVYHGVRQNLRRVLTALGPDRIEKGLTAFEDGASNWSECFFARAFNGEADLYAIPVRLLDHPRAYRSGAVNLYICNLLEDPNFELLVPVRMLWHTFDSSHTFFAGGKMTRADMRKFISDVLDESRPKEVMDLLRSINYDNIESKELASCPSST